MQVSYEDEQNQCNGSNVWLYLLMSLLLNHGVLFINYTYNENVKKINQLAPNFGILIYKFAFSIWGSILIIHSKHCIEESNIHILYKTGSRQYICDITTFFAVLVLSIFIWFKYDRKSELLEEQVIILANELGQYTNEQGEPIHSVKI